MHYLVAYELPALFVGAMLFGEMVLVAAIVLAAEGVWSLSLVFGVFFVGTVFADVMWFVFGRTLMDRIPWARALRERYASYVAAIELHSHNSLFFYMLLFKFLHGTRIITTVYLSLHRNVSFWTFLVFDMIVTVVWLGVFMGVGVVLWRSIIGVLPWLRSPMFALVGFIALAIIAHMVTAWLTRRYVTGVSPIDGRVES